MDIFEYDMNGDVLPDIPNYIFNSENKFDYGIILNPVVNFCNDQQLSSKNVPGEEFWDIPSPLSSDISSCNNNGTTDLYINDLHIDSVNNNIHETDYNYHNYTDDKCDDIPFDVSNSVSNFFNSQKSFLNLPTCHSSKTISKNSNKSLILADDNEIFTCQESSAIAHSQHFKYLYDLKQQANTLNSMPYNENWLENIENKEDHLWQMGNNHPISNIDSINSQLSSPPYLEITDIISPDGSIDTQSTLLSPSSSQSTICNDGSFTMMHETEELSLISENICSNLSEHEEERNSLHTNNSLDGNTPMAPKLYRDLIEGETDLLDNTKSIAAKCDITTGIRDDDIGNQVKPVVNDDAICKKPATLSFCKNGIIIPSTLTTNITPFKNVQFNPGLRQQSFSDIRCHSKSITLNSNSPNTESASSTINVDTIKNAKPLDFSKIKKNNNTVLWSNSNSNFNRPIQNTGNLLPIKLAKMELINGCPKYVPTNQSLHIFSKNSTFTKLYNNDFDSKKLSHPFSTNEESKEQKKVERMLKNRESASLSRKRKKEYLTALESRVAQLDQEKQELKKINANLRSQIQAHDINDNEYSLYLL